MVLVVAAEAPGVSLIRFYSGCESFGSAVVYTFSYVAVGGAPGHPSNLPGAIPATAGWIDSRDLSGASPLIRE